MLIITLGQYTPQKLHMNQVAISEDKRARFVEVELGVAIGLDRDRKLSDKVRGNKKGYIPQHG